MRLGLDVAQDNQEDVVLVCYSMGTVRQFVNNGKTGQNVDDCRRCESKGRNFRQIKRKKKGTSVY